MFGFGIKHIIVALFLTVACVVRADSLLSQAVKPLSGGAMSVVKIDKSSPVDLAVIDGGFRKGLRSGVRLSAKAADGSDGELIVVEVSSDRSVALLVGNFELQEGAKVVANIGR